MYQALYRKWRPKTFADMVGQEHVTKTLLRQVETNRLSHAYLLTGTRGTGKTTCAKVLAKAVNCENRQDGNPCNSCFSCQGIDDGSILDVLELDAASNNGVDQVRALRDEAVYTPGSVKMRVYIVDEVHMLTDQAENALLKILEEPPEHLLFILATTEQHKVMATIRSRCQQFTFKRILPQDISQRLTYVSQQEEIPLSPQGADLLARLADGGLRDALSLLDQCRNHDVVDENHILQVLGLAGNLETSKLMESIGTKDSETALVLLGKLYENGRDIGSVLEELSVLARDLLLLQTAPKHGASLLTGGYDQDTLDRLIPLFPPAQLVYMLTILQESTGKLTKSSHRRTDGELCLLRLCEPALEDNTLALSARIARLEAALDQKTIINPLSSPPTSTAPVLAPPVATPFAPVAEPVLAPPVATPSAPVAEPVLAPPVAEPSAPVAEPVLAPPVVAPSAPVAEPVIAPPVATPFAPAAEPVLAPPVATPFAPVAEPVLAPPVAEPQTVTKSEHDPFGEPPPWLDDDNVPDGLFTSFGEEAPVSAPPMAQAVSASPMAQAVSAPPMAQAVSAPPMAQAVSAPPMAQAVSVPPMAQAVSASPMAQPVSAPPMAQAVSAPPMAQAVSAPPMAQPVSAPPMAQAVSAPPMVPLVTQSSGSGQFWPTFYPKLKGRVPEPAWPYFIGQPSKVAGRYAPGLLTLWVNQAFTKKRLEVPGCIEAVQAVASEFFGTAVQVLIQIGTAPEDSTAPTSLPVMASPVPQPMAEPVAQAVAEPMAQPLAEPMAQAIAEPVQQPLAEPMAEPLVQAIAEPLAQAVAEPVQQPLAEPMAQPMAEPVQQPLAEPIAKPLAEPVAQPLAEPVQQPLDEPMAEPLAEPVAQPMAEPVAQAVAEPMAQAVAEPVAQPLAEPVQQPLAEPVAQPMAEPVAQALAEPVQQPLAEPLAQPLAEPLAQAVAEPVQQPLAEPMAQAIAEPMAEDPLDELISLGITLNEE